MKKCFACNKKLGKNPYLVDTRDDQLVNVGTECHKKILKVGDNGYKPKESYVKLYPLPEGWRIKYKHLLN